MLFFVNNTKFMKPLKKEAYTTMHEAVMNTGCREGLARNVQNVLPRVTRCLNDGQLVTVENAMNELDCTEKENDKRIWRDILNIAASINSLALDKCCSNCDNVKCSSRKI